MDRFDEDFWKKNRPGRLDEGGREAKLLLGGRHGVPHPIILRLPRRFAARHQQPITQVPNDVRAKYAALEHKLPGSSIQPVHFRQSSVSAPRTWSLPNCVKDRSSVAIFPIRKDVGIAAKEGAKYSDRHHVWTIASNSKFLTTPKGRSLSTPSAAFARERWRNGSAAAKSRDAAVRHQVYIERATRNGKRLEREIVHDLIGPILLGNIGDTPEQRKLFWQKIAETETRIDATLQFRIIAELPHDLPPETLRKLLVEFGASFESKQLGWFAAVHHPNTLAGGDARNVHVHIAYFDRPIVGWKPRGSGPDPDERILEPIFSEKKNRDCVGPTWIRSLRQNYVDALNRALVEHYSKHPQEFKRLYHPGSYSDIGILNKCRQRHLGQKATALERKGIPSTTGLHNVRSNLAEIEARESRCLDRLTELYAKLQRFLEKLPIDSTKQHAPKSEIKQLAEMLASQLTAIEKLLAAIEDKVGIVTLAIYAEIDPLYYAGSRKLLSRASEGDGFGVDKAPPPTYIELLITYLASKGYNGAASALIDELVKIEKVENKDEIIRQRRVLTSLRLPVLRELESAFDQVEPMLDEWLKTNKGLRKALKRDAAEAERLNDADRKSNALAGHVQANDSPVVNSQKLNNANDIRQRNSITYDHAHENTSQQSEDIHNLSVASAIRRLVDPDARYARARLSENDLKRFSDIELKQLYINRARTLEANERASDIQSLRNELDLLKQEIIRRERSGPISKDLKVKDPEVQYSKDTNVQEEPLRKPKRDAWDR